MSNYKSPTPRTSRRLDETDVPCTGRPACWYQRGRQSRRKLRFIGQAQGLGFTLKEIASVDILSGGHIVSCADALAMLARKHKTIVSLIAEARDRKTRIKALMAELQLNR